jgi:hypothetical protein
MLALLYPHKMTLAHQGVLVCFYPTHFFSTKQAYLRYQARQEFLD